MKAAGWFLAIGFLAGVPAEQSHALRQGADGLVFHYGLVPAEARR